jgi:hypothetical protein
MKYTVTKKVDADLAGVAGRLVMHFVDGSSLEVSLNDVKRILKENNND